MPKRNDLKYWNIPVTPHLNDVLEKGIELNAHVSKSEFIRSAVREKLRKIGLGDELDNIRNDRGETS